MTQIFYPCLWIQLTNPGMHYLLYCWKLSILICHCTMSLMIIGELKFFNNLTIALLNHAANTNQSVLCCHIFNLCDPFLYIFHISNRSFSIYYFCPIDLCNTNHIDIPFKRPICAMISLIYALSIVTHLLPPWMVSTCDRKMYLLL